MVMVYFSQKLFSMSDIDIEQMAKVKAFQEKISKKGVFFGKYNNNDDFERLIRMHLGMVMADYGKKWGKKIGGDKESIEQIALESGKFATEKVIGKNDGEEVEEEGFLDLVISSTEEFNTTTKTLERISEITSELNEKTSKRTDEINQLPEPKNPNAARSIVNQFADDLEYYYERMKVEIPILSKSFRSGIDKWTKAAQLLEDFKGQDKSVIENAILTIVTFRNAIINAKQYTQAFRDVVQGQARLTTKFNHSKRMVIEILTTLVEECGIEERLSLEGERIFLDVLSKIEITMT